MEGIFYRNYILTLLLKLTCPCQVTLNNSILDRRLYNLNLRRHINVAWSKQAEVANV